MSYAHIIGQEEALQVLKGALAAGKPGHAYLFHGAEGVGKTSSAVAFAQALNCERGGPEACGECLTCRRAEHGNLRDIEIIQPGSKSGQAIEIEQVRDLIQRASTRPTEGRRKVFILPQANRLSPPAMHTMLKTLEEPAEFVTLILETRDLTALLPTLISRCQTVRFRPMEKETVERILREHRVPGARAEVAAAYAQGSAGQALLLATDNAVWKRREQTLELMGGLASKKKPQMLRQAEDLQRISALKAAKGASKSGENDASSDKVEDASAENSEETQLEDGGGASTPAAARTGLAEVLKVVSAWFGDLLALQSGAESPSLRNPDHESALRVARKAYASERLYSSLDALLKAEYYLQRNANPRLLCEDLMLRICP